MGAIDLPLPQTIKCYSFSASHITLILRQLHWLPVQQRVHFKITVLVFQCLSFWQCTDISGRPLSSPTSACADSAGPTQRCVLFDVHTTPSAIGVLQWLDHASGTRCPLNYDNAILSGSSNGCLGTTELCDIFCSNSTI